MISPTDTSKSLALDTKGLSSLKESAKQNSPESLKAVAKQFEAVFMNMMLKSMRDASPQDGVFDSEQSKMFTSMLDQQMSQNLASRGLGLADVLVRQLSNTVNASAQSNKTIQAGGVSPAGAQGAAPAAPIDSVLKPSGAQPAHIKAFQEKLGPHAEAVSREIGIPAKFMLGQAALESGWGKHEIKAADGTSSHNLFGIKATGGWKGKVVETATTEYVNGVPVTKMEKFRAYDSYADGFRDYGKLLKSNPRYEAVLANAQDASGFAQGLQRAGYATDPNYAVKLTKIIKQSLLA